MGDIITWLIAVPIIGLGIYILVKNIKNGADGGGCSGCSGCGTDDEKKCGH